MLCRTGVNIEPYGGHLIPPYRIVIQISAFFLYNKSIVTNSSKCIIIQPIFISRYFHNNLKILGEFSQLSC